MTTKEILNLDFRIEKNKELIQRVLRKIKPLSKYSDEYDVPFDAIEKAIFVMCKKYNMRVREIASDVWANDKHTVWRATVVNETNMNIIDVVYGVCLYEVFAKVAIRLYAEIKKGIQN